jgi:hypothetical protein
VYLLSEDNHHDQAPSRGLAAVTGVTFTCSIRGGEFHRTNLVSLLINMPDIRLILIS